MTLHQKDFSNYNSLLRLLFNWIVNLRLSGLLFVILNLIADNQHPNENDKRYNDEVASEFAPLLCPLCLRIAIDADSTNDKASIVTHRVKRQARVLMANLDATAQLEAHIFLLAHTIRGIRAVCGVLALRLHH